MKKIFTLGLSLCLVLLISVPVFAYSTMTDGYYKKTMTISPSEYLESQYTRPTSKAATSWNSALSGAREITIDSGSDNSIESGNYGASWRGLYSPFGNSGGGNNTATSFIISINSSLVGGSSTRIQQGVIAHEMGHALGLAHSSGNILMNPDRDISSVYTPATDDINGAKAQASSFLRSENRLIDRAINDNTKGKACFDFPYYETDSQVFDASDAIICGTILDKSTETINVNLGEGRELNLDYNVYDVKVKEVIKGNVEIGSIVKIKQEMDEENYTDYSVNQIGIFMMLDFSEDSMPNSIINPIQGYTAFNSNTWERLKEM